MKSPFAIPKKNKVDIPSDTEVVFVADYFVEDMIGGAEMTSQSLIDSCPLEIFKLHSTDVTLENLEQGMTKHWVFGNFSGVNPELIPSIVANIDYSVLEYDYKYCRYRSPEKHKTIEMKDCDCQEGMHGKMVSAFLFGAKSLWWMSERQMERYHKVFPFLTERDNIVLSSVFDDQFFAAVKALNTQYTDTERKGWLVLGSTSWIKGTAEAENYCKENELEFETLWDVPYYDVLEKMAQAEGFVYLPTGGDTCPRMVIEAKLLGCKLHTNDNVEHMDEIWFNTDDPFDTEAYLYAARQRFWDGIKHAMTWTPTLSGYTTTLNCLDNKYPYTQSIKSMLGFCDQVVVVDGGSTDGTWEQLEEWAKEEPRLTIKKNDIDWTHPRFAVFDGKQKASARNLCVGEYCWQQDADEVVHEADYDKIKRLLKTFPHGVDIVSLPVIEYWGGPEKVRLDVNPWKWRMSRNKPYVTHGIPKELSKLDDDGFVYAQVGTDGCDYIHVDSGEVLPHASFYTGPVHDLRMQANAGNDECLTKYNEWFSRVIELLPSVHHYSWFDLERKIKTYRDYWSKHWQSLYNIEQEDTAENNMFFDAPWSDVSEEQITKLAQELSDKMGGWVFHSKVKLDNPTPHLNLEVTQPAVMVDDD